MRSRKFLSTLVGICVLAFLTPASAEWSTSPGMPQLLQLGQERLGEPLFSSQLAGKRVGILAHHASRDRQGQHIVDRLAKMPGLRLVSIFSPEHGYRSLNDEVVGDSVDSQTGLPVYSLYGPRRAPTPQMLSSLDVLLVDLQDAGLRYYTYPATVVATLRAAKAARVPVWILDRPNPLGGIRVEGLALEPALANEGFTTVATIPTRHGMTIGELSRYLNTKLRIGATLKVVPMMGWRRDQDWASTGLPWTPPSPALTRPEQVSLYAIFGSLEAGNLASGRGLDNSHAFERYGAPWINPLAQKVLVERLRGLKLPGIEFSPVEWTPDRGRFTGQRSRGFQVRMTRGIEFDSFSPMIQVLRVVKVTLGTGLLLRDIPVMVGSRPIVRALGSPASVQAAIAAARRDSVRFRQARAPFLLYPEEAPRVY